MGLSFESSLATGEFPEYWMLGNVILVFKTGKRINQDITGQRILVIGKLKIWVHLERQGLIGTSCPTSQNCFGIYNIQFCKSHCIKTMFK